MPRGECFHGQPRSGGRRIGMSCAFLGRGGLHCRPIFLLLLGRSGAPNPVPLIRLRFEEDHEDEDDLVADFGYLSRTLRRTAQAPLDESWCGFSAD
jgi:hypothetical protein